jgi:glycosyltransferase involved in cell wall biosynthesis
MPQASIVIVTRNRKEIAQRSVASALAQQGDIEVVVIDDASTDGTVDYLRTRFADEPRLHVHRLEKREGLIVQRNRAAGIARGTVIVSIDDDAEFVDAQAVPEILRLFDHPQVGAALIPFHNCDASGNATLMTPVAPDDGRAYVTNTFIGTAYAVRRDLFNQLGGFQGYLFHWGEESPYTQRLLAAGYATRVGTRPAIRHYPAAVAGKYSRKVNRYIWRNRLLTVWLNAPTLYLLPLWLAQHAIIAKNLIRSPSRALEIVEGVAMAYAGVLKTWRLRKPLPRPAFNLWMMLRKRKLVPLDEIQQKLQA